MIFCFKTAQNLVAEHYKRNFDMIFHYMRLRTQLAAEHYVRDFYMIFQFKVAQNFVAEHNEIVFEIISSLKRLKTWLQSTMKEDRVIGPALMAMDKNRFNLVLDNFTAFTRKKARRLKISSHEIQFSHEMR